MPIRSDRPVPARGRYKREEKAARRII